jgi:hypothetical protein
MSSTKTIDASSSKIAKNGKFFIARVAQLVERWTFNPTVQGSSPCSGVGFLHAHAEKVGKNLLLLACPISPYKIL